jgi:hypothetical protein
VPFASSTSVIITLSRRERYWSLSHRRLWAEPLPVVNTTYIVYRGSSRAARVGILMAKAQAVQPAAAAGGTYQQVCRGWPARISGKSHRVP